MDFNGSARGAQGPQICRGSQSEFVIAGRRTRPVARVSHMRRNRGNRQAGREHSFQLIGRPYPEMTKRVILARVRPASSLTPGATSFARVILIILMM